MNKIEIKSINEVLEIENLTIPSYQRPYKWTIKNIEDLLSDIEVAIARQKELGNPNFRYRVGTVLLHDNKDDKRADVIDGQQRIISFFLLQRFLTNKKKFVAMNLEEPNTKYNLCRNFAYIKDWYALKNKQAKEEVVKAFGDLLEVVVITVEKQEEAFQLFDSQNSRGKALYPHDLLKAYHLREMNNDKFEMLRVVKNWEELDKRIKIGKNKYANKIEDLFDDYLYPILNWSEKSKTTSFTANDIDTYKGIRQDSPYPYAQRTVKAMPLFQITEPFVAGKEFFEMVHYYLPLLEFLKKEVFEKCPKIKNIITNYNDNGAGFSHCKNLFLCAVLCYYDRFRNFDEKAITKLFTWAFMLRIDLWSVSYSSINKYAIGEGDGKITNKIPIFYEITHVHKHTQIANYPLNLKRQNGEAAKKSWNVLYDEIIKLNKAE